MRALRLLVGVAVGVLAFTFLFENYAALTAPFQLHLDLHWVRLESATIPVGAVLIIAFSLGFVLAYVWGLFDRLQGRLRLWRLEQRVRELEGARTPPPAAEPPPSASPTTPTVP